jgi:deoxyribose-phosphate aldolase
MSQEKASYPIVNIDELKAQQIASISDFTFLKEVDSFFDPEKRNAVANREHAFFHFFKQLLSSPNRPYAICIQPADCHRTKAFLAENGAKEVQIVATAGFPAGSFYTTFYKTTQASIAMEEGANEIDMVLAYEHLKVNDNRYIEIDIQSVVNSVHQRNGIVKLIIEVSELNEEQIIRACKIAQICGVDFIKTSTGYTEHGATIESIRLIAEHFDRGIKISGGVNAGNVKEFLRATTKDEEQIELNPNKVRIGLSSLIKEL